GRCATASRRPRTRGTRPASSGRRRRPRRARTSSGPRSSRARRTTTPARRRRLADHGAAVDHVAHQFDDAEQQKLAAELGMWIFLATEVMFFGGMILAYTAYRYLNPTAFAYGSRQLNVVIGGINTGVLLVSSFTVVLSVHAALAWRGRFTPAYHNPVEIAGLYWHFVDVVWIFLLPLLYLVGRHAP